MYYFFFFDIIKRKIVFISYTLNINSLLTYILIKKMLPYTSYLTRSMYGKYFTTFGIKSKFNCNNTSIITEVIKSFKPEKDKIKKCNDYYLPFYNFTTYNKYNYKIDTKLLYGDFTYPPSIINRLFSGSNYQNILHNIVINNGETHRKKLITAFRESQLTDYYVSENTVETSIFHLPMSVYKESRKDVHNRPYYYYMFINGINGDYVEFNYKNNKNDNFIISDILYNSNPKDYNNNMDGLYNDSVYNVYNSIHINNRMKSTIDDNDRINNGVYNRNILWITDLKMYFENLDLNPYWVLDYYKNK